MQNHDASITVYLGWSIARRVSIVSLEDDYESTTQDFSVAMTVGSAW